VGRCPAADIADAINILGYLFLRREEPECIDAADANRDSRLNIADPVAILRSLFLDEGRSGDGDDLVRCE
jgi:hypothetical protein